MSQDSVERCLGIQPYPGSLSLVRSVIWASSPTPVSQASVEVDQGIQLYPSISGQC